MPLEFSSRFVRVSSLALASFLTVTAVQHLAHAQEQSAADRTAAAEAYDNGTRRFLQHDYAGAANWFETANRMAPSALALSNAMRAHQQAGGPEHFVRAATIAVRIAAQYPTDAQAQRMATRTLEQLSPGLTRVTVSCGQCEIESDGVVQQGAEFFVTPGAHTIVGHWPGGRTRDSSLQATAGQTQTVTIQEPPAQTTAVATASSSPTTGHTDSNNTAPVAPIAPPRRGLSPFFFVGGLVVTAALGGVAVWSWLDATHQGSDLISYAMRTGTPNPTLEQSVQSAETRTIVLDIATGAVGLISVGLLIGTLISSSHGDEHPRVNVSASAGVNGYSGLALNGIF